MRGLLLIAVTACRFSPGETGTGSGSADAAIPGGDDAQIPGDGSARDPNDHLIAYYEMETIDSKTAADSSGHHHTATCTSCPTVKAGHKGMGFDFDGTTRFDVPDDGSFDSSTAFTIAIWVKWTMPSYMGQQYSCPVGKVFQNGIYNSYELCSDKTAGKWLYDTTQVDGNGNPQFDSMYAPIAGPKNNDWHHAAMVWDGSVKTLYIDGMDVMRDMPRTPVFDATGPLTFGADTDGGLQSSPFTGTADELRIYDVVLSPSEIAALAAP
ncbi:MAG: LamG domain-containing protein [Kofleriaceae bacterium]